MDIIVYILVQCTTFYTSDYDINLDIAMFADWHKICIFIIEDMYVCSNFWRGIYEFWEI